MLPYQMTAVLRETSGGSKFVSIPYFWKLDIGTPFKVVLTNRETEKQIYFCKNPSSRGSNLVIYVPKKLAQAMFEVGKLVNISLEPLIEPQNEPQDAPEEEGEERWPGRARAR